MEDIISSLLQANQTGNSNAMELEGAKRCFSFIKDAGLQISSFISDRHRGIRKWIRESEQGTRHFHDLCHVCKGVTRKLLQAGKENILTFIFDKGYRPESH